MLNIAFIGCSWTQGHKLHYTNTYPFIIHEQLNKDNIKNQVVNAGREGSSWFNYPQTLQYLHKKYDPDVYVIQHTTPDRGMLLFSSPKQKYQRITRDHDVYKNYIQLWDNTQSYYHLTVGLAERIVANEHTELVQHMISEIERKSSLKSADIIDRIKYWLEQERLHPLMFDKYQETIDYCDMYVKRLNKKVVHLFWLDDSFVFDVPNKMIVEQQVDFDKYVIDYGYHFDIKGNTELATALKPLLI